MQPLVDDEVTDLEAQRLDVGERHADPMQAGAPRLRPAREEPVAQVAAPNCQMAIEGPKPLYGLWVHDAICLDQIVGHAEQVRGATGKGSLPIRGRARVRATRYRVRWRGHVTDPHASTPSHTP
jgi:hypothetical protein